MVVGWGVYALLRERAHSPAYAALVSRGGYAVLLAAAAGRLLWPGGDGVDGFRVRLVAGPRGARRAPPRDGDRPVVGPAACRVRWWRAPRWPARHPCSSRRGAGWPLPDVLPGAGALLPAVLGEVVLLAWLRCVGWDRRGGVTAPVGVPAGILRPPLRNSASHVRFGMLALSGDGHVSGLGTGLDGVQPSSSPSAGSWLRTHVSSSVPGHVRSAVGRASARVRNRATGGSSAPVQRRTHLTASQVGTALTVEFTVRGTDRVDGAYALVDSLWVPCGSVERDRLQRHRHHLPHHIDLAALAADTAELVEGQACRSRPAPDPGDDAPAEGTRVRLFVEVASPSGYVRPLGRVVAWGADGEVAGSDDPSEGARYRDPLGQYETTDVPRFDTVETEQGPVTPFVNSKGILSVLVGAPMEPASQVRNDGLSVARGRAQPARRPAQPPHRAVVGLADHPGPHQRLPGGRAGTDLVRRRGHPQRVRPAQLHVHRDATTSGPTSRPA